MAASYYYLDKEQLYKLLNGLKDVYRRLDNNTFTRIDVGDLIASNASVTNTVTVGRNPQANMEVATKKYVDDTWTPMTGATSARDGSGGYIDAVPPANGYNTKYLRADGTWSVPSDTKNTAGSTDISSKIYLIGATSQSANPQTFSHDTAYVGSDGLLYSGGQKVSTIEDLSSKLDKSLKGVVDGLAELDSNGVIVASQLPDYIYEHAVTNQGSAFNMGFYKVATNKEGHVISTKAITKADIVALGIPTADTHYASKNVVGSSNDTITDTNTELTNGNVYLNSVENGAVTSAHNISGSGATTVTTDNHGNIIIDSPGTVTNVTTGIGLVGGSITSSGTIKANLLSETPLYDNISDANKIYPVAVDLAGHMAVSVPWTDTKNTAGASNTSSRIYLIGALMQRDGVRTYSHSTVYVDEDGRLYSGGSKIISASDLSDFAYLDSPAFIGEPTAPTANIGTNNTQIATTEFVMNAYTSKAAASGGTDLSLVTTGEKYNWNNKTDNEGTVTQISAGTGLSGGNITVSGTIKTNLLSETALTNDAVAATETIGRVYPVAVDHSGYLAVNVPWTDDDTKNTAGATDTSSKIYLIGALSQDTNPQTYSQDTAYVGTDGCLYSNGQKVLTAHQDISGKLDTSLKGAANGLAELDEYGFVPSSQLPSYVDDVVEYASESDFPETGESGKIYVDSTTNLTYRWSGTVYVQISSSLALGTTSSTAFRGDHGQMAYTHAVTNKGSAFNSGLYKITTNSEGHVTDASAVVKGDITALGIPESDTTYSTATTSADGLMSSEDKTKLNGIANGANNYVHPSYTAQESGLYKVTVDSTGHVSAVSNVQKSDITSLGIPGSDTTYDNATTSAAGLMSSTDKTKLDGIESGANAYVHPSYTAESSGLYKIAVDATGHVSGVTAVAKSDITALGIPGQDTWTAMVGATSTTNGSVGYVNAAPPSDGYNTKYLRADGTWAVPPDTTYSVATEQTDGLMSHTDRATINHFTTTSLLVIGSCFSYVDENGNVLTDSGNVLQGGSELGILIGDTDNNLALEDYSVAAGTYVTTSAVGAAAFGKYNVSNENYAFMVGNGSADNTRSNAFTVSWSGDATVAGTVTASAPTLSSHLTTKGYVDGNFLKTVDATFLPTVTSSDNGKVLTVVNGEWMADDLPSASGVSF